MAWGLAIVALLAFVLAFTSHSPGWMGFGIFVGFVCALAAALMFIERHVRASSRPEHMTPAQVEALRKSVRQPEASTQQLPPGSPR